MNIKKVAYTANLMLKNITAVYIACGFLVTVGLWNLIQSLTGLISNDYIDTANYLYLFAVLAPIIIPAYCLKKILSLNAGKDMFFKGTLLIYIIAALIFSVMNLLIYSLTNMIFGDSLTITNLSVVFGWRAHGVIICLLQQFTFFFLTECFFHTLTCTHFCRFGIITDLLICVTLAVFIPIASLRKYLIAFFNLIIFNDSWLIQMISCLILSAVLYLLSVIIIIRKKI